MGITIDKSEIIHYGYYTGEDGEIYPFSVEIMEVDEVQLSIEILWDDDQPHNVDEIEDILRTIYI
jgi:hypothetical protein